MQNKTAEHRAWLACKLLVKNDGVGLWIMTVTATEDGRSGTLDDNSFATRSRRHHRTGAVALTCELTHQLDFKFKLKLSR